MYLRKPPGQPTISKVLFFFKQQSPKLKIKICNQTLRPDHLSPVYYIVVNFSTGLPQDCAAGLLGIRKNLSCHGRQKRFHFWRRKRDLNFEGYVFCV